MDIRGKIKGLHHVTATVDEAQADYDFYTKLLGLRLVKETVNFDNEQVYHFYYGNKTGAPSTIFTTFPYHGQGVRKGQVGAGQVGQTSFSVPESALPFWRKRFHQAGIECHDHDYFGRLAIEFIDPSGLRLDITGDDTDTRTPVWTTPEISTTEAIRGVHSVTLWVHDALPTTGFLQFLGYEKKAEAGEWSLFETGQGGAGNRLILRASAQLPRGTGGIGTVHHVAHRVESLADSLEIHRALQIHGITATEVKDRKYFQSIYFRIPGGILFEIATEAPGFLIDEPLENLGSQLCLPDWQEPHRERIEANLMKYVR